MNFISRELKKNRTARPGRCSAPAKRERPRSVGALLDERLVKLPVRRRVDERPTVLAVVLQTHDVRAEERRKLSGAVQTLALVADLIVEYVRLHLHLDTIVLIITKSEFMQR